MGLANATGLLSDGCTSPQPTVRKVPRIGVFSQTSIPSVLDPFRQGLRELGYVPGENIAIEYRYTMGDRDPGLARALFAELVALNPDVIVAGGLPLDLFATKTTNAIPIVAFPLDDPVASGLVASLARPGGNVTGFIYYDTGDTHTSAKRLELLKQAIPTALRVASLGGPGSYGPAGTTWWKQTQDAAQALGLQLVPVVTSGVDDLERAFDTTLTERADALIVAPEATLFSYSAKVADVALRKHLPAMFPEREYVEAGGLLSYGPSFPDMLRRVASYVDRILKGAKPADLPVERPSKFDFVINLRTATALGVTIPPSVLSQATEVLR